MSDPHDVRWLADSPIRQVVFQEANNARLISLAGIVVIALAAASRAEEPEAAPPPMPITAGKNWTVLHKTAPKAVGVSGLPEKSPLHVLNRFALTGPRPGDDFLFGNFESDAEWGLDKGGLQPTSGKNAALLLATAASFDLEGTMSAEGLGGWFFLVGWKEGHGYMLYNVTLKTSGSPWLVSEFRGATGIEETHREVTRHIWKGQQPFRLTVENNMAQLTVGKEQVLKDVELPNYHEGQVVLGAYDTKYGAKPLKIQSLRIRAK